MTQNDLNEFCKIDEAGTQILKVAMDRMGLSARAYDRILKVARTIADIENQDSILPNHLAEAIQFRSLDREGWAG
jgi:magnesium chelatase family protein